MPTTINFPYIGDSLTIDHGAAISPSALDILTAPSPVFSSLPPSVLTGAQVLIPGCADLPVTLGQLDTDPAIIPGSRIFMSRSPSVPLSSIPVDLGDRTILCDTNLDSSRNYRLWASDTSQPSSLFTSSDPSKTPIIPRAGYHLTTIDAVLSPTAVRLSTPSPYPLDPSSPSSSPSSSSFSPHSPTRAHIFRTDYRPHLTAAIQSLISSNGGVLYLGPYTYSLSATPIGTTGTPFLHYKKARNVRVVGMGPHLTRLKVLPNQILVADHFSAYTEDTINSSLEDVTLDGSHGTATRANEQVHSVRIGSKTSGFSLIRVRGINVRSDFVQMVGSNLIHDITDIYAEDTEVDGAGRSGFSINRSVDGLDVNRFRAKGVADQAISSEPSGTGTPPQNLSFNKAEISHSSPATAVSVGGRGNTQASNITFIDLVLVGGGFEFRNVRNGKLIRARIVSGTSKPTLQFVGNCERIFVDHPELIGSSPFPVLRAAIDGPRRPTEIEVSGGVIHQLYRAVSDGDASGCGVEFEDARDSMWLERVKIIGAGHPATPAVKLRVITTGEHRDWRVMDNWMINWARGMDPVQKSESTGATLTDLRVSGNVLR